jgi:glycosyl transferase family 87
MSNGNPTSRPFVIAWIVYVVCVFGLAVFVWVPTGLYKEMDYRMMYTGGMLARTDPTHLYDFSRQRQIQETLVKNDGLTVPFPHLAAESLIDVPFSLLDYRGAYLAMIAFNAVLIAVCFFTAREAFSIVVPVWQPRAGLIFFTFMPVTITLAEGQDSLILLFILCLTWKQLERSNRFVAGLILAAMLFKPHLALLIALLLAVRLGVRFLAGFVAGGGIVTAICLPFWLHGGWSEWRALLWRISLAGGSGQAEQIAAATYPASEPDLHGLFYLALGHFLSARAFFVVVVVATVCILAWALARVRKLTQKQAFAFSIFAAALLGYHFEEADLTILLLPIVLSPVGDSKVLIACRHALLGLPIALLIFAPATPPGAGFAWVCIPLAALFFVLGSWNEDQRPGMTAETV